MKITTTFWSDKVQEFSKLLYINGNTKEIIFEADLNDVFATYNFFKNIAKFVKSPTVLKTVDKNCWKGDDYYQFAVIHENEIWHIKWFNLVINDNIVISHDIAFETTLIKKNDVSIPFGKFPMWYRKNTKLPKYREFNIKARAYKYMANQVKKYLFKRFNTPKQLFS